MLVVVFFNDLFLFLKAIQFQLKSPLLWKGFLLVRTFNLNGLHNTLYSHDRSVGALAAHILQLAGVEQTKEKINKNSIS